MYVFKEILKSKVGCLYIFPARHEDGCDAGAVEWVCDDICFLQKEKPSEDTVLLVMLCFSCNSSHALVFTLFVAAAGRAELPLAHTVYTKLDVQQQEQVVVFVRWCITTLYPVNMSHHMLVYPRLFHFSFSFAYSPAVPCLF
jgi:hypothetical protein